DADAPAYPDLRRLAPAEIEATIGPFHHRLVTQLHALRQGRRVITDALDEEGQPAILLPGRGDGEGMRPLVRVEGHEGELPRLVSRPAVLQAQGHAQHPIVRVALQFRHLGQYPAALADTAGQRD